METAKSSTHTAPADLEMYDPLICPQHHTPLRLEGSSVGPVLVCPVRGCQTARKPKQITRASYPEDQRKLPGFSPGKQTKQTVIPEDTAQEAVKLMLEREGYIVLVTTKRRHRITCEACRHLQLPQVWDRKLRELVPMPDGCDKGIPDLLISREDGTWFDGLWLGMEIKGTDTPLSEEQTTLMQQGRIIVLRARHSLDWTVKEALRIVREREEQIGRR